MENKIFKYWTEEETQILKANYEKLYPADVAKLLNRSVKAVHYKAWSLDLTSYKFIKKICKEEGCIRIANNAGGGGDLCSKHWLQNYRKTEKGKQVMKDAGTKSRQSVGGRYIYMKHDAKRRSIKFSLTKEQYSALIEQNKCAYCPAKLSPTSTGLDRLDSSLGYVEGNVVPCCRNCNVLKGNILTPEETKETVKLLQKLRGKEDIWT